MCRRGRSGSARHRTSRRTRAHGDAPLGHRVRVIGAAGRDADGVLLSRVMSSASEHVSDVSGAGCGSRGRRDMSSASSTLTTSPQWTLARRAAGPSHRRSGAARRCYDEVRSGGRRLGPASAESGVPIRTGLRGLQRVRGRRLAMSIGSPLSPWSGGAPRWAPAPSPPHRPQRTPRRSSLTCQPRQSCGVKRNELDRST